MKNVLAFLVGLLLAMAAGMAFAAESCTLWRTSDPNASWTGENTEGTDKASVCTEFANKWRVWKDGSDSAHVYEIVSTDPTGGSSGQCKVTYRYKTNAGSTWSTTNFNATTWTNLGSTPCPPGPCDEFAGKKVTYAQNFPGGLPEMGGNFNIPVAGGCGAERSAASSCTPGAGGAYFCMVTYTYTGEVPESSPTSPGGSQADCAMIKGERNCAVKTDEDTGQTCGTFNGERVCFPVDPTTSSGSAGQPPSGACWSTASGGMLCAADAVVEDGEGDPVSPTQTLVTNNSTSNYYTSTSLVSSGATVVVTGAGNMGSDTPGADADCDGLDCLEGGDMTGAGDAGDVASGAMGRIGEAPIIAAVSGLSGALTGGACPSWATTIEAGAFGTYELDFSFICSMWEDIAPVIAAVMLAGWVLVALRILMSA